ncbi:MAG: hypothetical protein EU529_13510 [Promethearchaeota archaeon]|nr:MAG: hypothetical protein EU529_13510 [Candidatus Lokiarchaeota archaeon]
MQNIKAKKESLIRLLGMVLILFGLLITLVVDIIFLISNIALYLLIIIPWLLLIILLKLEIDFVVDRTIIFFIIICVYTIIMSLVALLFSSNETASILFIMLVLSDILLLICWHFAISIFKRKKILSILCGIGYLIITFIFRLLPIMITWPWLLNLASAAIVLLGMVLILFAEMRMKGKGLLNYI